MHIRSIYIIKDGPSANAGTLKYFPIYFGPYPLTSITTFFKVPVNLNGLL